MAMNNNSARISLRTEVHEVVDDWVFGSFFAVINGLEVGNREDSVDLKGCLRWWEDFANNPRDRYEPMLYDEDKESAYLALAASVLVNEEGYGSVQERYEDTFARFHISHLGMSSFDNVTILLVKSEAGLERLIWKTGSGEIHEAYLAANELEEAFSRASTSLAALIEQHPHRGANR